MSVVVGRSTGTQSTSPRLEAVRAHHQTPEHAGQHQQEAEPDEAHADDRRRRSGTERQRDGDGHGADRREPDADGEDDERAAVGRRNERHIDGRVCVCVAARLTGTPVTTLPALHH